MYKMLTAGLGAGQREPLPAARRPAAHHGVGDFRVKLDAVGRAGVAKCLHLEDFAFGEQLGAGWEVEAFPVPLIDDLGPSLHHGSPGRRDPDRIIANLGLTLRMKRNGRAKVACKHLRAKANPKKGLALTERHLDPFDLRANVAVRIVDAHRPAENDHSRMRRQCVWKRIAAPWAANIQWYAAGLEKVPDAAGSRLLLMQHNQNRPCHGRLGSLRS